MTTAYDAPHDEIGERRWGPTQIALGVVVALIVAMWVWIYVWAPRDNPDRLETRAFAQEAETICAPFVADFEALPRANTETTITERTEAVAEGTRLTAAMVEALRASAASVTDENDRKLLDLWFADWDAYVDDREAYVARLEAAPPGADRSDFAFTLTERSSGGIYTVTIDGFAAVNDMGSCAVPRDI